MHRLHTPVLFQRIGSEINPGEESLILEIAVAGVLIVSHRPVGICDAAVVIQIGVYRSGDGQWYLPVGSIHRIVNHVLQEH